MGFPPPPQPSCRGGITALEQMDTVVLYPGICSGEQQPSLAFSYCLLTFGLEFKLR